MFASVTVDICSDAADAVVGKTAQHHSKAALSAELERIGTVLPCIYSWGGRVFSLQSYWWEQ